MVKKRESEPEAPELEESLGAMVGCGWWIGGWRVEGGWSRSSLSAVYFRQRNLMSADELIPNYSLSS